MYRLLDYYYYEPEKPKNKAHTNERRRRPCRFVWNSIFLERTTKERKRFAPITCAFIMSISIFDSFLGVRKDLFFFWFFIGFERSNIPASLARLYISFSPERGRKERPRQLNLIMLSYIRRERATATACSCIHTYRCVNALSRLGLFSLFLPP